MTEQEKNQEELQHAHEEWNDSIEILEERREEALDAHSAVHTAMEAARLADQEVTDAIRFEQRAWLEYQFKSQSVTIQSLA